MRKAFDVLDAVLRKVDLPQIVQSFKSLQFASRLVFASSSPTDLNVDDGVGRQTEHFQTVQVRDVLDVANLVRTKEQSDLSVLFGIKFFVKIGFS